MNKKQLPFLITFFAHVSVFIASFYVKFSDLMWASWFKDCVAPLVSLMSLIGAILCVHFIIRYMSSEA